MKMSKSDIAYVAANPGLSVEELASDLGGRFTARQVRSALKKVADAPPSEVAPGPNEEGPVGHFYVKKGGIAMTHAQSSLEDGLSPKNKTSVFEARFPGCVFDPRKKK